MFNSELLYFFTIDQFFIRKSQKELSDKKTSKDHFFMTSGANRELLQKILSRLFS